MSVEIVHEDAGFRAGSKVDVQVRFDLIDSKTGKKVGEGSSQLQRNERVSREEPKY